MPIPVGWPDRSDPVELATGEAHVWAAPLVMSQAAVDGLRATLTPDEQARADDYLFEAPRRRFVVARSALRRLLGSYLDASPAEIALSLDSNQKPRLSGRFAGIGLQFNVSHSDDLALIAFATQCEVGVDLECLRDVGHLEQIARRFFHPAETDAVLATSLAMRDAAFLRCWTGKEAVLKARGTGIVGSLADFQVPVDEAWQGWVECSGSQFWVQRLAPSAEYIGAIACAESKRRVCCWKFCG